MIDEFKKRLLEEVGMCERRVLKFRDREALVVESFMILRAFINEEGS